MMFTKLTHFFAMNGYAIYIWPVYLMALIILVFNVKVPYKKYQRLKKILFKQKSSSKF